MDGFSKNILKIYNFSLFFYNVFNICCKILALTLPTEHSDNFNHTP